MYRAATVTRDSYLDGPGGCLPTLFGQHGPCGADRFRSIRADHYIVHMSLILLVVARHSEQ
jgi:hypothetical protein